MQVHGELTDMGSGLPEPFCRMVCRRLEAAGYGDWDATRMFTLAFSIRKAETEVLDYCHIDTVPQRLYAMLCDRACGQYLHALRQTGKLELDGLDLSGVFTSLSEGDVKIDFDKGTSDGTRLDVLLERMMHSGKDQLQCYRKIRF